MNVDAIGLILIPVSIFLIGTVIAGIRGAIRFAQYMVRSEEAQQKTAESVHEMAAQMGDFMAKTDARLTEHGEQLAVVRWELERNGISHVGKRVP